MSKSASIASASVLVLVAPSVLVLVAPIDDQVYRALLNGAESYLSPAEVVRRHPMTSFAAADVGEAS